MIEALMPILTAALVGTLLAALALARQWLTAKLAPSKLALLSQVAQVGVQAAEQWAQTNGIDTGEEKFDFVASNIMAAAKQVGLKLTDDQVSMLIEAAVREYNNLVKPAVPDFPTDNVVPFPTQ